MATSIFNARFTPTSSSPLSADTFQVTADIYDGNGQFSGLDLDLDDIIFLDTYASLTSPYTVSRYTIDSIVNLDISSVEIVLKYADTGDPVDPGEILGNPGFIGRRSSNALVYDAAPTIHTFPDYVTQYARNYDQFITIDSLLGGGGGGSTYVSGTYANSSGSSIAAITLVRQDTSSEIAKIDPSSEDDVANILGVLLETTADGASGIVALSGLIKQTTTSFAVADVLYLAKDGSATTDIPDIGSNGFAAGDFVVKIGRIVKNVDNPSDKDLKLEIEVIGQL